MPASAPIAETCSPSLDSTAEKASLLRSLRHSRNALHYSGHNPKRHWLTGYLAFVADRNREFVQEAKGLAVAQSSLSKTCATVPGEVFGA